MVAHARATTIEPQEIDMLWDLIGFVFFGLFVGVVARLLVPGRQQLGLLGTLGLGVAGSLIGGLVAWFLGTGDLWELDLLGGLVAIVAAVLLVGAAEAIVGGRSSSRT